MIGSRRREVAVEHIGGDGVVVIAVGRPREPLRDLALDVLVAHQAPHPLLADGLAGLREVLPQAWTPIAPLATWKARSFTRKTRSRCARAESPRRSQA